MDIQTVVFAVKLCMQIQNSWSCNSDRGSKRWTICRTLL